MLRDQALALSGLLVGTIGGPPVRPYQPDGVWAEATFGTIRYQQDMGSALYRRSLYTFWKRNVPAPAMLVFDASLRARDPRLGIRAIEHLEAQAGAAGLRLQTVQPMPANNWLLRFVPPAA